MATKLQIYNMAISAARGNGNLTSTSQSSREAEECNKWYDLVVDVVQEAAYWPCCRVASKLPIGTPASARVWQYSYPIPTDFLRAWYLEDLSKFELASSGSSTVIFANTVRPVFVYAKRVTDTTRWTPGMTQAVIYALASKIARPLTGKEGLVEGLINLANNLLVQAQTISFNEPGSFLPRTLPDFLAVRGISDYNDSDYYYPHQQAYYYPFGESFSIDG